MCGIPQVSAFCSVAIVALVQDNRHFKTKQRHPLCYLTITFSTIYALILFAFNSDICLTQIYFRITLNIIFQINQICLSYFAIPRYMHLRRLFILIDKGQNIQLFNSCLHLTVI